MFLAICDLAMKIRQMRITSTVLKPYRMFLSLEIKQIKREREKKITNVGIK